MNYRLRTKSAPRPRLSDVAKEAGVSLGAASKALSHPTTVRPNTLAAVRKAVSKLGYIPSESGRALASQSTRLVGLVVPTINNPVFASFIHDLQKVLAGGSRQLLALAHEYDRATEAALVERLVGRRVDAMVLIGTDHDPSVIDLLERVRLPYLRVWSMDDAPESGVIGISNRNAMHPVIKHVAALGHRKIGVLGGDAVSNERTRWRLAGIREAAQEHHLTIVAEEAVPLTINGGREGFRRLDPLANGMTAVVCLTDIVAAGLLDAARQAGLDVPGDLSITGFDDIELAQLLSPPLTTVSTPISEMARRTGDCLMDMLSSHLLPRSILLGTSLVVRGSTGSPRTEPI
jgi:LacI family transcriptional regulator